MADTRISDDPSASALTGAEVFPLIQGGVNKKVTVDQALANRSVVKHDSDKNLLGSDGNLLPMEYLGFRFNFDGTTQADGDPGVGKLRYNSATSGATTFIYIDLLSVDSIDLTGMWAKLAVGGYIQVTTASSQYTFFRISSVVNASTYYKIGVVFLAGPILTNGKNCIVTYIPAPSKEGILAADNFARFASNGAGGLQLVTNTDEVVESTVSVYALPGVTITGVPTIPSASSVAMGTVVLLHKDNFVGQGSNPVGVYVVSDGTNWNPYGNRQVLFSSYAGTVAAPTWLMTTTGKFSLTGADPKIPLGLLKSGSKLRFLMTGNIANIPTSPTGPTFRTYIGSDLTTYSNNLDFLVTLNSADATSYQLETLLRFTSTTSYRCTRALARGGSGSTGGWQDKSGSNLDTTSTMMVSFGITSMGTATQINLFDFDIIWEA